ncbi:MAG: FAD-dependent oxidoreductase [Nitrososphaerota archaeon]|nr:FAD-dependent oxidoreductase [Nitrososphaerota archaeon]MDG6945834.1 FAD-dependent oxidoreductase [Nitrososphaerota archaeon]MDG6947581.1 FAD-dependent oxidoreductase [Nitrososphaerota archaeon]
MDRVEYLIVGGGLAAVYAAAAIRGRDKAGKVVIIGDELHLPYDRVPLSKGYLMDRVKREALFPKKEQFLREQGITVIKGRRAVSLDVARRSILLDDGSETLFGKLLLATGGRPRRLPIPGSELRGIYYFRTIDDCEAIKQEILSAKRAVIVGGGFIGCELAAAFTAKGVETTIIEAASSMLSLAFDPTTAKWVESYFVEKGVKVVTGSSAAEFLGEGGRVTAVKTKDGTAFPADLVVVGIGIMPNTDLAEKAGLKVDRGIVVNEYLETDSPGIFAAGDVARFFHPVFQSHLRVEHYDVAVSHGRVAGANMAGGRVAFTEMPHFFSYMFDLTINAYGDMNKREVELRRGEVGRNGFMQFFFNGGRLTAFLSANRPPGEIKAAREILAAGASYERLKSISDLSRPLEEFVGQKV